MLKFKSNSVRFADGVDASDGSVQLIAPDQHHGASPRRFGGFTSRSNRADPVIVSHIPTTKIATPYSNET